MYERFDPSKAAHLKRRFMEPMSLRPKIGFAHPTFSGVSHWEILGADNGRVIAQCVDRAGVGEDNLGYAIPIDQGEFRAYDVNTVALLMKPNAARS